MTAQEIRAWLYLHYEYLTSELAHTHQQLAKLYINLGTKEHEFQKRQKTPTRTQKKAHKWTCRLAKKAIAETEQKRVNLLENLRVCQMQIATSQAASMGYTPYVDLHPILFSPMTEKLWISESIDPRYTHYNGPTNWYLSNVPERCSSNSSPFAPSADSGYCEGAPMYARPFALELEYNTATHIYSHEYPQPYLHPSQTHHTPPAPRPTTTASPAIATDNNLVSQPVLPTTNTNNKNPTPQPQSPIIAHTPLPPPSPAPSHHQRRRRHSETATALLGSPPDRLCNEERGGRRRRRSMTGARAEEVGEWGLVGG
ncbi:hypothetical protein LTR66_005678 [Elasticomyces elasticus]|nr:hypothetical protein LTR66_005678 [Elasticomyces elasticus]